MSFADVAFNLLGLACVAAVLLAYRRHKSARTHVCLIGLAVIVLMAAAIGISTDGFGALRLFCWGLYVDLPLLLAGSAVLVRRDWPRTAIASAIGSALLLIVAADAFVIEPRWLEVSRVSLKSSRIIAPLKIVILADIQTDRVGDYERATLKRAMGEKPDILLFAGDYIQIHDPAARAEQRKVLNALLREVGVSAPLGAYAVAGNVDAPGWEGIFEGLPVFRNSETSEAANRGVTITCLSMSDSQNRGLRVPRAPGFHIVLGHMPDFSLGDVQGDLLVAGHTHGGQVRIPGFGPIMTLSKVPRDWAAGVTDLGGGRTLIVSRGIGMERDNAPRLRFFCRPEIVVVEIQPEK